MAAAVSEFEPWLIEKLRSLKTDEGVFGSYISGILDSEDNADDKKDALEGILSEIVVSSLHRARVISGMINHVVTHFAGKRHFCAC